MFYVTQLERLHASEHIVKDDQYRASLQADQILERARADADEIIRQATQHYQSEKQRGYVEGKQEAQAEAAKANLTRVIEANNYFQIIENRVVDVVCRSLKMVLGDLDQEELLFRAARHSLRWARSQTRVSLRVSPDQAASLRSKVESLREHYPAMEIIDIVADEHLGTLDCVLETDIGTVDASIDTQIEALRSAFEKSIRGENAQRQREDSRQTFESSECLTKEDCVQPGTAEDCLEEPE